MRFDEPRQDEPAGDVDHLGVAGSGGRVPTRPDPGDRTLVHDDVG